MVVSFIHGPMMAGKTSRLIKGYDLSKRYKLGACIIKPIVDTRGDTNSVTTHDNISRASDVYTFGKDRFPPQKKSRMVFVDESQFFSVEEVQYIINRCETYDSSFCIFYGLAYDYAQQLFPSSAYLMERAHITEALYGKCAVCDDQATHTQRLVNGLPAPIGERILVGGAEQYESRCKDCYVHPNDVEELF